MAGATVVLESHELAELGRGIRRLSRAKLGPLMRDIAKVGEEGTLARIREGGPAPDGADWPDRHPAYDNPRPVLNLSGALGESIESDADEDTVSWGSSIVYARIHQLGGTIKPKHGKALAFTLGTEAVFARSVTMPARPYLGYGDAERQGVEDVVEAWLEEALGADGAGR